MYKPKIGILIYNYNRADDVRISLEIIENIWKKSGLFSDIKTVHVFNGQEPWYPKKYLEDDLVKIENHGHFQGSSEQVDIGVETFKNKYPDRDFLIVLAADTWSVNPGYNLDLIEKMKSQEKVLATCSWSSLPEKEGRLDDGIAFDYFIFDFRWFVKEKIFPLDYKKFAEQYKDFFYYKSQTILVEALFLGKFVKAIHKLTGNDSELRSVAVSKIYRMKEREPIHLSIDEQGNWKRRMYFPEIGLLTHHDPNEKKRIVDELNLDVGEYCRKLRNSDDLSYYNNGFVSYQRVN